MSIFEKLYKNNKLQKLNVIISYIVFKNNCFKKERIKFYYNILKYVIKSQIHNTHTFNIFKY